MSGTYVSTGKGKIRDACVYGALQEDDKLCFRDGDIYIQSDADGYINIVADSGIKLNSVALTASATELNTVVLTARLPDISTASSAAFVVSPVAGTLSKVYTVIHGAITVADATLTANVNGGTDVTNTITVAYSGSAAGVVDSCTPGDNNTVAAGNYIKLTSDGGSTDACEATVSFVITL